MILQIASARTCGTWAVFALAYFGIGSVVIQGAEIQPIAIHRTLERIDALGFRSGTKLVTIGKRGEWWKARSGALTVPISQIRPGCSILGHTIIASRYRLVTVIREVDGRHVVSSYVSPRPISFVGGSRDGSKLAIIDHDMALQVCESGDGLKWKPSPVRLVTHKNPFGPIPSAIAMVPCGDTIGVGYSDGSARTFNWKTGRVMQTLTEPSPRGRIAGINDILKTESGLWVIGTNDAELFIYSPRDKTTHKRSTQATVKAMASSTNGELLVVAAFSLEIWDLKKRVRVFEISPTQKLWCTTVAFSDCSEYVATGWNDGTIKAWKTSSLLRGKKDLKSP